MPFSLTFRAFLLFLSSGEGSGWPSHVLSRGLSNGLNLYLDLIHSFIQTISVAPLQVHSTDTVSGFLAEADLPKVPTLGLQQYSNPRPSGRKASTLPMRHHVLQDIGLKYM